MELVTPADGHPTSTRAIEARWLALPAAIKDKLAGLEARKDALHGGLEALRGRIDRLRADLTEKRSRLEHDTANTAPLQPHGVNGADRWTGGAGSGVATFGGPPGPERQQEVDRLAADLGRLEAVYQSACARWEEAARTYQAACEWLERTAIAAIVPVVVKYERVPDARGEVEMIRAEIAALSREAEAIERAPIPTGEALQRLDALARDVAARRGSRISERARVFFSRDGVRSVEALFGLVQGWAESPRELAAAIRERCETDFLAERKVWEGAIRTQAVNGEAVSSSDRPKRLAEIERRRRELEQREEHIILAAERDGLDLDRRSDADPGTVLTTALASDVA